MLNMLPFFMSHTKESCFSVASSFQNKADFKKNANAEYQWLCRNALVNDACAHMTSLRRSLSDSDIAEIAAKYGNRRAFKLADQSAYMMARKRGLLDAVCAHMKALKRALTDAQLAKIAFGFKSRSDFCDGDSGAYQSAIKRGILDEICAHMDGKGDRRLTDAEILKIASKFKTRNDFKLADFGAYTTAIRRGLDFDACAHMKRGAYGFDDQKPASLYHYRITLLSGLVLFKIGITNRKPRQRMFTMGIQRGYKADLIRCDAFALGRDAKIAEKRLHEKLTAYRYDGPPVMRNGNTELFIVSAVEH